LDIFKLFGKIYIDDEEAHGKLGKIGESASKLAEKFGDVAKFVGTATVAAVGAATTAVAGLTKTAIEGYAEYEQLVGGMEKIFSDMDISKIEKDASEAYKTLGMSASEYLAIINDVGASFASTMGDEAGYEAAKKGLTAISDYASGTGKNFNELQQKLAMITRSTSSYQSIADQFSGILPATSEGFLQQAQAAGILSTKYKKLTDVPIAEYQKAVTDMLAEGVDALNLTGNTAAEAATTLSGSVSAMKSAWSNLVTGIADDNANMEELIDNFVQTLVGDDSGKGGVINNILPKIEQSLDGVGKLVDKMIPIIVDKVPTIVNEWLPKILQSGVSMVKTLLDGMLRNSGSITSGAVSTVMTFINGILDNLPSILVSATMLIGQFASGLIMALPEILARIPEIIRAIIDAFSANSGIFLEIGKSIVVGIWNGICALWTSLVSNFSNLFNGLFAGMNYTNTGTITVNGSHADGLAYVPFDGYVAQLHEGERVLTKQEAREYNRSGDDNPIKIVVQSVLDGRIIGETAYNYSRQKARAGGF
jgi:hypothetical protein